MGHAPRFQCGKVTDHRKRFQCSFFDLIQFVLHTCLRCSHVIASLPAEAISLIQKIASALPRNDIVCTNKNLPSTMGREEDSRGTTQIHYPSIAFWTTHFAPTIIGCPVNAGIAVQTTRDSFTRTAREGTSTDFRRVQFHRLLCTSLAASFSLLSSVTAFMERLACYIELSAKTGRCQERILMGAYIVQRPRLPIPS